MDSLSRAESRYRLATIALKVVRLHKGAVMVMPFPESVEEIVCQMDALSRAGEAERRATRELGAAKRALDLAMAGMSPAPVDAFLSDLVA